MKLNTMLASLGILLMAAVPATADITEAALGSMHYPQLPDPTGWDVDVTWAGFAGGSALGDDFLVTMPGQIDEVVLWVSWYGDDGEIGEIGESLIANVGLSINNDSGYGQPGPVRWSANSSVGDFTVSYALADEPAEGWGDQGWIDPFGRVPGGAYFPDDHSLFYKITCSNFTDDPALRVVEEGNRYWLAATIMLEDSSNFLVGWKTSGSEQFGYNAVLWTGGYGCYALSDPQGVPIDLAFAITILPEPATMALLLLGGGIILARRRRKR